MHPYELELWLQMLRLGLQSGEAHEVAVRLPPCKPQKPTPRTQAQRFSDGESKIQNGKSKMDSLDHFIRPRQHIRRNRYADLLCGLEIDDEFKLRGLLNR